MDWESGPIRQIKTEADFVKRFDVYFTPEIRKAIAAGKPGPLAPGEYGVTWKARGNEYTIFFKPAVLPMPWAVCRKGRHRPVIISA